MFCPKCGKNNPDQAKFCQGCGQTMSAPQAAAPVPVQSAPSQPQPAANHAHSAGSCCQPKSGAGPMIGLGLLLLGVAAVVFAVRFNACKAACPVGQTAVPVQANAVVPAQVQPVQMAQTQPVVAAPVQQVAPAPVQQAPIARPTVMLLISEQNINGPQKAWWASQIDLSATESRVAQALLQQGYNLVDPAQAKKAVSQNPAFSIVGISDPDTIKLASLAKAQYVVVGKAIASAGGKIPSSNMISCFANVSAKLIRVKDGAVIAYLDATGKSVHVDTITGGTEALNNAAGDLGYKLSAAMSQLPAK